MSQCSDLFVEVFNSHCGGIVRTCACGITTFNFMDRRDFDEGEFEELESKQKSDPEHYRAVDHSVGTMEIGGQEIVIGCACDKARQYEAFITGHASRLAEYLRRYADALRKRASLIDVPDTTQPRATP
jgi:hypothetical protein